MKVVGVRAYGGPEVLQVLEREEPHATGADVRIRVATAGVNPVDAMVRDGRLAEWFGAAAPPFIPGMDAFGVIDEVGPDVDASLDLVTGQEAVGLVDNFAGYGAYAQYVVLPAVSVIPRPEGATAAEAGSFLMNAMTARCAIDALRDRARRGRLLVTGAAGGVGANIVALAARDGFEVIALAADSDRAFLTGLGATDIVDTQLLPGTIDAVIDTAGIIGDLLAAVKDRGVVIVVHSKIPRVARGIAVSHVNVRDRIQERATLLELGQLAGSGVLPLRVAEIIPAAQAATAHEGVSRRGTRGRFVLDVTSLD